MNSASKPFKAGSWLRRLATTLPFLALGLVALLAPSAARAADIKVIAVTAGDNHSLFTTSDGRLWAMGYNYYGQLGIGSYGSYNSTPVLVNGGTDVIAEAAGGNHSLFVTVDGRRWGMGDNSYGQLGKGNSDTYNYTPVMVAGNTVIAVTAGGNHSLFVTTDDRLRAMGSNGSGQLGNGSYGSYYSTPVLVNGGTDVIAEAAGGNHSLFVTDDGRLWAMGYNYYGQLGIGSTDYNAHPTPVQVPVQNNARVIAVTAGDSHSLFVTDGGNLWAMGRNDNGQLGDGTNTDRNTPVLVNGGANVIAMAAGDNHSLFVTVDGKLWAMGNNDYGQLGDGTYTTRNTPVRVNEAANVIVVAAGGQHSLFVTADGKLWAMGRNNYGQLGDGTYADRNRPELVVDFNSGAFDAPAIIAHPATQTITAGGSVTFSVLATGSNLSYQWMKDGSDILYYYDANSASYTITYAGQYDAGAYSVRVWNPYGTVTSNIAMLTVNDPGPGPNPGPSHGGGGAPSLWLPAALAALLALRQLTNKK